MPIKEPPMSMNSKYILAIDLGTSGPKAALVTTYGEVVGFEFQEIELILLPNGGAEQKPDEWWNAIMAAAKQVLSKNPVPAEDIIAVSCTTQWSGTVAIDRNGNPLMNAIIWMDTRGSRYVDQITDGIFKIENYSILKLQKWLRLTGGAPTHSGKDPIAHILYIKHELPEIYREAYKFLEPKDYINYRLTGKIAASFDSIALHWLTDNRDIARVVYDDQLIQMAGVEREKFPDLKLAVDILGPLRKDLARELGLSRDTQVIVGTPDIPSAAVGSGAVRDYEGHLYIGTSSWLTCHVPFKKTDILHNLAALPSAIPGKYFIANEQETAGACLNFLRDNILYHKDLLLAEAQLPDVYKIFDQIAANVPAGSGNIIFTPWLYGERTPIDDHSVRSGIFNMSLNTTREHIIRAVLEGVAYNTRWLLGYLEKFIKRQVNPINFIGGGANSNVWGQIMADVLNRTIRQVKDPIQANVRGAAFLASAALGYITFNEIADRIQITNTYTPNPQHRKIYDELFKEFKNIYKANRKIYARLNKN
jgi:xylulokinase